MRLASRTLMACSFLLCIHPATQVSAAEISSHPDAAVRREILAMDARLSDAYADCRTQRLRRLFARDAELVFAGRGAVRGVSAHLDMLRREGCRHRRETVAASHEIYAVPGLAGSIDGAIQVGTQRFCAPDVHPCRGAETRFVALWHRSDDGWKITHMIRYDYAEADGNE